MKNIAKPLKNNKANKLFKGLDWKDILIACVIITLMSAIWIPLMINKEIWAGIGTLLASFALSGLFFLKIGEFKIYTFIYQWIRFHTTKVQNKKINFVKEVKNNVIALNDTNHNVYEFYRIIGKDVSLLNGNDFNYLATQLSYFFKDHPEINLLKIDGKINLNKISNHIYNLNIKHQNSLLQEELKASISKLNELKESQYSSTQPKYFLSFKKAALDVDIKEKIEEIKKELNAAELNLIPVTDDEMNDIQQRLYFNNAIINEENKYIKIEYHEHYPLTSDEKELQANLVINETFLFRDKYYCLINQQKKEFLCFNEKNKQWNRVANPFIENKKKQKYIGFIAIKALPAQVDGCWLANLFNIKGLDINLKLKNTDMKNLDRELTRVIIACEEKLNALANNNAIKFKKMEQELAGYEALANALADGEEIKNISCLIKVEKDSPSEVSQTIRWIAKILKRQGFEFTRLQFSQFDALKEFFANSTTGLKTNPIECLDNILGYGYPFVQQEIIDDKGLLFGLDENKTPVFIDWKKIDQFKNSSSMILLGKTGSGKSTTTKRIIKNQIMSDEYKIFVIDPENEYGELFTKFGGQRILMNDPNQNINPFDLNLPTDADNDQFYEAINNKMIFLSTFFKMIFEHKISAANIEWLLQRTNELLVATKNQKEIIFSDLYNHIYQYCNEKWDVIEQVGYFCNVCNGNKAYIWDQATTIDMNNNYIVFEFRELLSKAGASAIGTAQIYLVLQFLNNIVLNNRIDNSRYINIIIDEAHLLIDPKYIQVVQFVTEMFKRIRKYNGMMTLITQNVTDFYKPEIKQYSMNLINNAFFILAHSIKSQEVPMLNELMAEQGGLKEAEKEFLTSPSYGQCLLIFNRARTKIAVQQ